MYKIKIILGKSRRKQKFVEQNSMSVQNQGQNLFVRIKFN